MNTTCKSRLPHGTIQAGRRELRNLFAGQALVGLLADPEDIECEPGKSCEESVAIKAFRIAEQMVKLAYEN